MKKLSNDDKYKLFNKKVFIKILNIILSIATIVLALCSIFFKLSIIYALISFILEVIVIKYYSTLDKFS